MTDRGKFILDDDDLDSEELIRNSRVILEVLAGDAGSFETDIPKGHSDDKPRAVVEAAERLFQATGRPGVMDPTMPKLAFFETLRWTPGLRS